MAPIHQEFRAAVYRTPSATYPAAPFHPSRHYPEYHGGLPLSDVNHVYEGVRQLFRLLDLDLDRFDTPNWNPLGNLVQPGDRVVIKPNLLWHSHKERSDQWLQVITHGSIVRAVVDYVLVALQGRGEIVVADGPQLDAHWEKIVERSGLASLVSHYASSTPVPVRLLDLRTHMIDRRDDVSYDRIELPGDPRGQRIVALSDFSRFNGMSGVRRYYGADYDRAETNLHHAGDRHDYGISETIAAADVFINLPKMKTHKKVGVTLSLKNLVGIATERNWLPHHTEGTPSEGGDQFPEWSIRRASEAMGVRWFEQRALAQARTWAPIYRLAKKAASPFWGATRDTIRNGNWSGNDTAWRMVHDLNRCLLYSGAGPFPARARKKYLTIIDGVIGGDGNGPASPDVVESRLLVGGTNPVAVDTVTARLMGFDPARLKILSEAFAPSELPLVSFGYDDIAVTSNVSEWNGLLGRIDSTAAIRFRPHFGWIGRIEHDAA